MANNILINLIHDFHNKIFGDEVENGDLLFILNKEFAFKSHKKAFILKFEYIARQFSFLTSISNIYRIIGGR